MQRAKMYTVSGMVKDLERARTFVIVNKCENKALPYMKFLNDYNLTQLRGSNIIQKTLQI